MDEYGRGGADRPQRGRGGELATSRPRTTLARTLSTVADLTDYTALAAALRGDAMRARTADL